MTPAEIKAARKALGLTGRALAEALGINQRTLRRYEQPDGQPTASRAPKCVAIAIRGLLRQAGACEPSHKTLQTTKDQ